MHPDNPEVNIIKAVRTSKDGVPLIFFATNITPSGLVLVSNAVGYECSNIMIITSK